jgi:hypothetical protein
MNSVGPFNLNMNLYGRDTMIVEEQRDCVSRNIPLRQHAVFRDGRVRRCGERSLVHLPAEGGLGLRAVCRHRARAKFRVVDGEEGVVVFGDADCHDAHCGRCGFLLYSVVRDGALVHVAMGMLVDEPSILPTEHIFAG